MTSKGSDKEGLDLGLSAILAGAEIPVTERVDSTSAVNGDDQETRSSKRLSEYEAFSGKNDWAGLAQYCEGRLAIDGDQNVDARLWWILAQKHLKTLPAILLAAPLEAAMVAAQRSGVSQDSRELADKVKNAIESLSGKLETEVAQQEQVVGEVTLQDRPRLGSFTVESSPTIPAIFMVLSKRQMLLGGLTCLLFVVVGGYLVFGPTIATAVAPIRVEMTGDSPVQLSSVLQPRNGMGNLSAIYYDMGSQSSQAQPTVAPTKAPPTLENVALQPPSQPVPVKRKEQLDMSGPSEPPELRNRINAGFGRSDGTRFEPPVRSSGDDTVPRNERPRIQEGGVFEMLVRTNVLSEPSIYGRVIARLESGDRIRVDAHLGRWVRIVGSKGRPGFVLAQDIGQRVR